MLPGHFAGTSSFQGCGWPRRSQRSHVPKAVRSPQTTVGAGSTAGPAGSLLGARAGEGPSLDRSLMWITIMRPRNSKFSLYSAGEAFAAGNASKSMHVMKQLTFIFTGMVLGLAVY